MSIVALKRRAKLLNNQSGRDPSARMLIRDGCECPPGQVNSVISTGGGFSLNGKYRNIGRVGKNSLQSIGGSDMKPGTTNWNGSGGCCGGYEINPSPNNQCCLDDSNTVKPSTLNTRGMLANRFRWTKRNIPASNFTDNGARQAPDNNQIQEIYNNWVSGENGNYNIKKSSQQYTENLAATLAYKNRNLNKDSGKINCALDNNGKCSKGHHIGGKYKPAKPYAKLLNFPGTSSRAIDGAIAKRASLFPKGYDKPFPYDPQPNQCIPEANQGDDPNVLKSYYADENNTSVFGCLGKDKNPVIVGGNGNKDGEFIPVIWQSPGSELKNKLKYGSASSINKLKQIVGVIGNDGDGINVLPAYWSSPSAEAKQLTIDLEENQSVDRILINNSGMIVADIVSLNQDNSINNTYIVFWSSPTAKPKIILSNVFLKDLNNEGQILISSLQKTPKLLLFSLPTSETQLLSLKIGDKTYNIDPNILSLNDLGQIVGSVLETSITLNSVPIYWSSPTSDPQLLSLKIGDKTYSNGAALSINNLRQIVGYILDSKANKFILVYWSSPTSDPQPINLEFINEDDKILKQILAKINDLGQIIIIVTEIFPTFKLKSLSYYLSSPTETPELLEGLPGYKNVTANDIL